MKIGYARTSTLDQTAGLEAQRQELQAAGCEKIFDEQVSSVDTAKREKLTEALDYVREGDTLIVAKLDRLARSTAHLLEIVDTLEGKGAALHVLDLNLDTSTSTGRLMLTVLGGIAQFEREIMLERQREGIAKAKAEGKYTGRKPTARAKAEDMKRLSDEGYTRQEIADTLKVSVRSVYRVLNTSTDKGAAA